MRSSEIPTPSSRREVLKTGMQCLSAYAISGAGVLSAQQKPGLQAEKSSVTVSANQLGPRIDPRFFGAGLMYWTENDKRMTDGKIANDLKEMKCRLLRFPGGTESDAYLWNTHRLADKRRWPWKDGPGTMDTDEFISLCRKIGADPLICVNTEIAAFENLEAGVKLAADWVRYCNIEKKYGVVFWEIGNEPYYHTRFTPAEYGRLFLAYAKAMKAVDPTIKLVAVGEWNVNFEGTKERIPEHLREEAMRLEYANEIGKKPRADLNSMETRKNGARWWPTVFETAGSAIDIASFHFYFAPDYELVKMPDSIAEIQKLCREIIPGKNIPLIATEWSMGDWVETFGLQRALAVAEAAGKMIQGGVMMSAYWPLSCKGPHERKSLIDSWTVKRTANYAVLSLMANTIGTNCIDSADGSSGVYSFATKSADGRGITLYLINRTRRNHDALEVVFPGVRPRNFGAKLLSAKDPKSNDTTLVRIPCEASPGGCRLKLPAWSMAVLRCSI